MKLETLQKDMIAAMKAKDKERKDSISSLIGAVKKVAIDEKVRDDIPEELVDRVILKEMKKPAIPKGWTCMIKVIHRHLDLAADLYFILMNLMFK